MTEETHDKHYTLQMLDIKANGKKSVYFDMCPLPSKSINNVQEYHITRFEIHEGTITDARETNTLHDKP